MSRFLAAVIVVVSAVLFIHRAAFVIPNAALLDYGGATLATVRAGQWWRLIASQFLHVYLAHALLNAAAVWFIGGGLERILGSWRFLVIALVSGVIGQLVAINIAPAIVATGASQAALGIAGAAVPTRDRRTVWCARAYIAIQLVLDLGFSGHLKLPHAAGFAAGTVLGLLLRRRDNPGT
ncbi:MAG TPA: rhomboid family intramembrane serine protease [Thermoanaerobaculia bacterium]|nr:rhomboid family intramembrane serine protease [Thermoanaerobaculia bacterium]